jgi:hypothetical protein
VAALIASVVTASVFSSSVATVASGEPVTLELEESAFWDAEQATTLSAMTIEPATAIINFFMLNMPLLLVTKKRHPQALCKSLSVHTFKSW